MASAELFSILKWVGAAYLVYLGFKLWRSARTTDGLQIDPNAQISARGVFAHNAFVTALNPKSIAFFIAFVPQFLHPEQPLLPQFAILIATFVTLAALNALAYALMADKLRKWIAQPRAIARLTRGGGLMLMGMGVATAFMRRPA